MQLLRNCHKQSTGKRVLKIKLLKGWIHSRAKKISNPTGRISPVCLNCSCAPPGPATHMPIKPALAQPWPSVKDQRLSSSKLGTKSWSGWTLAPFSFLSPDFYGAHERVVGERCGRREILHQGATVVRRSHGDLTNAATGAVLAASIDGTCAGSLSTHGCWCDLPWWC
jgi:hypothetical protein